MAAGMDWMAESAAAMASAAAFACAGAAVRVVLVLAVAEDSSLSAGRLAVAGSLGQAEPAELGGAGQGLPGAVLSASAPGQRLVQARRELWRSRLGLGQPGVQLAGARLSRARAAAQLAGAGGGRCQTALQLR